MTAPNHTVARDREHKLVLTTEGGAVVYSCQDPHHDWWVKYSEPPTVEELLQAKSDHLKQVREAMLPGIYGSLMQDLGPWPRLYGMTVTDGRRQWWESAGWSQCSEPLPERVVLIGTIPEELS